MIDATSRNTDRAAAAFTKMRSTHRIAAIIPRLLAQPARPGGEACIRPEISATIREDRAGSGSFHPTPTPGSRQSNQPHPGHDQRTWLWHCIADAAVDHAWGLPEEKVVAFMADLIGD